MDYRQCLCPDFGFCMLVCLMFVCLFVFCTDVKVRIATCTCYVHQRSLMGDLEPPYDKRIPSFFRPTNQHFVLG
eukprot:m.297454 g.297454  ORF g.297454 m.297454 type:complete len:74 (+) comp15858_c6_seq31:4042-4263(+)